MRIAGAPVIDAKKPLKLKITKSDVTKGATKDPGACAAARCLIRELDAEAARVHLARTYVKIGREWVRYETPESLRAEIVAFDRGGTFEPGEYHLRPLRPSQQATGKRRGSAAKGARDKGSKNRTPKKPRAKPHMASNVRAHGANR